MGGNDIGKIKTFDLISKMKDMFDLEGGIQGMYRFDGIHLSEVGLDIPNLNLQTCIEKAAVWGDGDRRASF